MLNNWLKRYALLFVVAAVFFFGLHRFLAFTPGLVENAASYVSYPVLVLHSHVTQALQNFFAQRATNDNCEDSAKT